MILMLHFRFRHQRNQQSSQRLCHQESINGPRRPINFHHSARTIMLLDPKKRVNAVIIVAASAAAACTYARVSRTTTQETPICPTRPNDYDGSTYPKLALPSYPPCGATRRPIAIGISISQSIPSSVAILMRILRTTCTILR